MRWVLVVLVVLILVGVWVLALFVPALRGFAELLTEAIVVPAVLIVLGIWLYDRIKRVQAERRSKPPIAGEGEAQAEIAALRERLRGDVAELQRIVGSRAAVRKLPRILALATAASDSGAMLGGLGLSAVSSRAPPSRPEAAPGRSRKRCEVWSSRQAIVVSVGGLEAGDSERDGWLAVLDELRRLRARPIDGVIVTLSVPELVSGEAAKRAFGSKLAVRLQEVLERLEMIAPVYLVITKADELPGFLEFWHGFPRPDDVSWGASFSLDDERAAHEPARSVERELDALARALRHRLIDCLPNELDPVRRIRLLRFPLEFRALFAPLTQFVTDLCRPGPAPERFVLRGFYFVSAPAVAARRSIDGRTGAPEATRGGEQRTASAYGGAPPYFLTDFFRSVVLPDRDLATRTERALRKLSRKELRASLVALGVSLLVIGPALASYVHNVDLAAEVEAAGRSLASADPSTFPGTRTDPIETSLDVLNRCGVEATSLDVPGWIGPRAARALRPPLAAAYVARLHSWISRRVRRELERRLDAIASGGGLADAPATVDDETPLLQAYETVKLFATAVDPKDHANGDWAASHLAAIWRALVPDADAVPEARLVEHSRNYLAALAADPALAWPASHAFSAARERLRRSDVRGVPYRRVLLAAGDAPAVRASAIFGPSSLEFLASRGDVQVPGAFTALGWQKIREALRSSTPLPQTAAVERWVLDDASLPRDDPSLRSQVRQAYFDEYVRRWMSFLDEVKIKTPVDVPMAKAELSAFKEGDGFYKTLFNLFKENAIRDDEDPGASILDAGGLLSRIPWLRSEVDAGAKAAPPSPVEKGFRSMLVFAGAGASEGGSGGASAAPLSKYLAILDKLQAALDAPAAPRQSGQDPQSPFTEASTGAAALLDGVEEPTRGRLWRLLMPPVMGGVQAAKAEGVSSLSDDWKSGVWTAWDEKLRERYPFARASRAEPASFADFTTFFRPDGILWTFVHGRLGDWVQQSGDGAYVVKPGADALSDDAMVCLTEAQEITDAFFGASDGPGLKFSVQADWSASDVSNAKFWVGTKDTSLPKAQWAGPIRWSGEDVRLEWQEQGRPTQELGRHSFSLFDLFDQLGGLKPVEAGRSLYAGECPPLKLEFRPEGSTDALRSDFFTRLHCPRDLRVEKP